MPTLREPRTSPLNPLYSLLADAALELNTRGPGPELARILLRIANVAELLALDPRITGRKEA